MAPFNTHFLIAEKIWPQFDGPWQPYYGQFCFGWFDESLPMRFLH